MSRKLGVIGKLVNNIRNSLGAPKQKVHFVGQDHLGNQYFVKDPAPPALSPPQLDVYSHLEVTYNPSKNLRGGKWVETRDKDEFNPPKLPVEWEAWLRGRRDNPPTQEELDKNYVTMVKTINRAEELEKRDFQVEDVDKTESKESSPGLNIGQNIGKNVTAQDRNKAKFPIYEDMEVTPGEKYQKS